MVQLRTNLLEEAKQNWVENSIRRNPERIRGIVYAYFQSRQPLKWAISLLKTEDEKLVNWVDRHYRDRLTLKDLKDPSLLSESHAALDALTQILNLGSIYSFQK